MFMQRMNILQALQANASGSPEACERYLRYLVPFCSLPDYQHKVAMPAAYQWQFENGLIYPRQDAVEWLWDNAHSGWTTSMEVNSDGDAFDLVVSFNDETEATMFKLRWFN